MQPHFYLNVSLTLKRALFSSHLFTRAYPGSARQANVGSTPKQWGSSKERAHLKRGNLFCFLSQKEWMHLCASIPLPSKRPNRRQSPYFYSDNTRGAEKSTFTSSKRGTFEACVFKGYHYQPTLLTFQNETLLEAKTGAGTACLLDGCALVFVCEYLSCELYLRLILVETVPLSVKKGVKVRN